MNLIYHFPTLYKKKENITKVKQFFNNIQEQILNSIEEMNLDVRE